MRRSSKAEFALTLSQADCKQEPLDPSHGTVVLVSTPHMTAHMPTEYCKIECPHLTEECGEWARQDQ